ncbi:MAG: primosomal protein N' [Phycisphaerales bacterium]
MTDLFGQPATDARAIHTPGDRYVRVAIERSLERATEGSIDNTLTYRADADVLPGDRVRVPLGSRNRPTPGIVVVAGGAELLDGLNPGRVKRILDRAGGTGGTGGAAFPPDLLPLAHWIAEYYITPLGMVLGAMMPAAAKKGTGTKRVSYLRLSPALPTARDGAAVQTTSDSAPPPLSPALAKKLAALQALDAATFPITPKDLHARHGISPAAQKRLIGAGLLSREERTEVHSAQPSDTLPTNTQPIGENAATGSVTRPLPTLTPHQHEAVAGIAATLSTFTPHLVLGVTGSGKTEVYLRVIDSVLARGQSAIVLVPEIALTPQTSRRFIERLGPAVAVLHSGLSSSQRHAQWAACAAGTVRVVVGARSAVFAPLANLGLIVVDEEHDSSYKQDQLPRYHGRDVAVKRAHLSGCPVVLGSATPSLESYANAIGYAASSTGAQPPVPSASPGKYRLWHLPTRATGSPMPRVQIVDLADERRLRSQVSGWRDRHLHLLGPTLERALDQTLAAGGQAMLLLNRRGYANYITCADPKCGWLLTCTECDATMVYHRPSLPNPPRPERGGSLGFVRCHHCLAEIKLPASCPVCRGTVNTFGLGTQRVEEELERKFAVPHGLKIDDTLLRLDGDTMRTAKDYFRALDRFAEGKARVLLGTQMIAKGLDFPNVRLVGVINADTALALPDFRASERTYQLVSQVAGRAGRADHPGLVIVQTMEPRSPAIQLAARHDFEAFARAELETRVRSGLPPAARMARIVCRHKDHPKAVAAARAVHDALREAIDAMGVARTSGPSGTTAGSGSRPPTPPPVRLRAPFACPLARIAGHHRIAVELLAHTRGTIQSLLQAVRAKGLLKSDTHTAVDVDPIALL